MYINKRPYICLYICLLTSHQTDVRLTVDVSISVVLRVVGFWVKNVFYFRLHIKSDPLRKLCNLKSRL